VLLEIFRDAGLHVFVFLTFSEECTEARLHIFSFDFGSEGNFAERFHVYN
jgi:hypothetical protein